MPCRIRGLVARTVVAGVNSVAAEGRYLEVHSTKLNDITDAHHLLLVIGEEVFQNLVNGAFLADDQPHRSVQIYIVFFILVSLSLSLGLLENSLGRAIILVVRDLAKVGLVKPRFVVGPQTTVLMLHHESKNDGIFRLQPSRLLCCTCDFDAIASHKVVRGLHRGVYILVMT